MKTGLNKCNSIVKNRTVYRKRLFTKLDKEFISPVLIVTAPYGYGKSTLIQDWLCSTNQNWVWWNIDNSDNLEKSFINHLLNYIGEFQNRYKSLLAKSISKNGFASLSDISTILLKHMPLINNKFRIVIDNYEFITNNKIHDFLCTVIPKLPSLVKLILISKKEPPFPLSFWQSKLLINRLGANELSFEVEEIDNLLKNTFVKKSDHSIISLLKNKTEGWISGIQWILDSGIELTNNNISKFDLYPSLHQYFFQNVFNKQPERIKTALLVTSFFNRFSVSFCKMLFKTLKGHLDVEDEYNDFLGYAIINNLFLTCLDKHNHWYRYHNLFRSFLQTQAKNMFDRQFIQRIFYTGGIWFSTQYQNEEAIGYYLESDVLIPAIDLVYDTHVKLFNEEKWLDIESYLRLFTLPQITSSPKLMIIQAWIYQIRGNSEKMFSILNMLERAPQQIPIYSKLLRGEFLVLKCFKFFHKLNVKKTIEYSCKALSILPENSYFFRGWARSLIFEAYAMNGELAKGLSFIYDGHKELGSISPQYKCKLFRAEAFSYLMAGDLERLAKISGLLKITATNHNLMESITAANFFQMIYFYHTNNLFKVKEEFEELKKNRNYTNRSLLLQSIYIRSLTYLAEGNEQKAQELIKDCEAISLTEDNNQLYKTAQFLGMEIACRTGNIHFTKLMYDEFEIILSYPLFEYFIPHLTIIKILIANGEKERLETAYNLLDKLKSIIIRSKVYRLEIEILIIESIIEFKNGEASNAKLKLNKAIRLAEEQGDKRILVDYKPELSNQLGKILEQKIDSNSRKHFRTYNLKNREAQTDKASRKIFTNRELDIIELLAFRYSNKEIGSKLFIEPNSVKRHTIRIYKKLEVHTRQQAVLKAYKLDII
jgi:LuxR family maltose regulon positive regulatory protein